MDKFFRCPNCQSYSLAKSEPNFYEKAISMFIPVYVYECSNCAYRYIDKDIVAVRSRMKKFFALTLTPLIIISVLFFMNVFDGADNSKIIDKKLVEENKVKIKTVLKDKTPLTVKLKTDPEIKNKVEDIQTGDDNKSIEKDKGIIDGKPEIKAVDDDPETVKDRNNIDSETSNDTTEEKNTDINSENVKDKIIEDKPLIKEEVYKYIYFRNSRKYGVNWKRTDGGIIITRISIGSVFHKGGIKKGDVLSEVNGLKLNNGNKLNKERDKLFTNKIGHINLKVIRDGNEILFKLVRIKTDNFISRVVLKVRSSHPSKKEKKFKWRYNKKNIYIFRKTEQRVYIAGDFAGKARWAVDDTIMLNGKSYPGIKGDKDTVGLYVADDRKFDPLDITDIIPAGKRFKLKVELINHGILFGNTDIFFVVK